MLHYVFKLPGKLHFCTATICESPVIPWYLVNGFDLCVCSKKYFYYTYLKIRGFSKCLCFFLSPSGKLVQIEYALAAVAGGAPSVGIKAANGVVFATEKKQKSILYDE